MKVYTKNPTTLLVLLVLNCNLLFAETFSGFYLPEPAEETTMRYKSINNLIVLPVTINGNLHLNLVLDTGTRNIVLFGKRFQHLFHFIPARNVRFSGMGSGKPVNGKLSISNKVELASVIGENISLVVVPNKNIFSGRLNIDGIIGYDIFQKFEIEINPAQKLITFRTPMFAAVPPGFARIPMRVLDTKPVIDSSISFNGKTSLATNLVIDTGSELSIILKTTDNALLHDGSPEFLGNGMNGEIEGIKTTAHTVRVEGIHFYNQPAGIILSEWHNYGSIGMGILKEYVIILNYTGEYACLKKL